MNELNTAPVRRRGSSMRKNERLTQDEILKKLIEDHKENQGDVVWVRIDDRTHIELPANMSEEDRKIRIKNYLKNSNFKPIKRL